MPADIPPYYAQIQQAGSEFGVDPKFAESILESESGGRPTAVSPTGARGLMQIEPSTATGLARDLHLQGSNPFDPRTNIREGVYYLSQLIKHFHGNLSEAAAGYNAGGGAVEKYGGIPPYKETQNYVKTVMGRYRGMGGTGAAEAPHDSLGWGLMPDKTKQDVLASSLGQSDMVTHTYLTGLQKALEEAAPWAKALYSGR